MTASYTTRWLLHSMHYKLALGARQRRQPRPAHFAGRRRFHQRQRHRHAIRATSASTITPSRSISIGDQSRLVLDHPVGHFEGHDRALLRLRHSRISVLGRGALRLFRDRHHAADRAAAVGAVFSAAGGGGELPLRPRAHPRIQRADRAAQGRGSRNRRAGHRVRGRVHDRSGASSTCAHGSIAFNQFYSQISDHHPLCRRRALLLSAKKSTSASSIRPPTHSATSTAR